MPYYSTGAGYGGSSVDEIPLGVNNYLLTSDGAGAAVAEANLQFDGSTLAVTGALTVSTTADVTGALTAAGGVDGVLGGVTPAAATVTTLNIAQPAAASGTPDPLLTLTGGAHTGLAASTEAVDVLFPSRTVTFAQGALALQRAVVFGAQTYAFDNASTVTLAIGVDFERPVAGTNATFTKEASARFDGITAPGAGSNSEAFGLGALAPTNYDVAIGRGASCGPTGTVHVCVGGLASVNGNGSVGVGYAVNVTGGSGLGLGYAARAAGAYSIALGPEADSGHDFAIAIGRDATTTAAGQLVIGSVSSPTTSAYIGEGVTSATPQDLSLGATGGSGTDIDAGDFYLDGAQGTGAGDPGDVFIRVSDVLGTGTTLQTLRTVASFTPEAVIINDPGSDMDFRVEGVGEANALFVQGSDGFVGIGTSGPSTALHVVGTITSEGNIVPDGDGTRDIGVQTSGQYANVWADAINGADYTYLNGWRTLEAEKYDGYPRGIAIGHEGFTDGKVTEKMQPEDRPVFVVTDAFIEYQGVRMSAERFRAVAEGRCN